jgi:hypothetical protein
MGIMRNSNIISGVAFGGQTIAGMAYAGQVIYPHFEEAQPTDPYLTFVFVNAEDKSTLIYDGVINPKIHTSSISQEYSLDNGSTWNTFNSGADIAVTTGTIKFRRKRSSTSQSGLYTGTAASNNAWTTTTSGYVKCSGQLATLVDYQMVINGSEISGTGNFAFSSMFNGNDKLLTPPQLSNNLFGTYCYRGMFYNCSSLTAAPELPATTLTNYCYQEMFYGCTQLAAAPVLNATNLADHCYRDMFNGCVNLATAPVLPATTLNTYCYASMFMGCSSLLTAPTLPAATLATNCYYSMFRDCIGLTTAPSLPAITLFNYCYYYMFYGCTSLTTIPSLPAIATKVYCYNNMFNGCSSLQMYTESSGTHTNAYRIPTTGTGTTISYALNNMFASLADGSDAPATPVINTTYYTQNAPV